MKTRIEALSFIALLSLFPVAMAGSMGDHDGPMGPAAESDAEASFACSAISELIRANEGTFPATGPELMKALGAQGDVLQTTVPFSQGNRESSLGSPRLILSPIRMGGDKPIPLNVPLGQLYVSVILGWDPGKKRFVPSRLEFISWNRRTKRFDFGVADGFESGRPRPRLANSAECLSCHRSEGPIFSEDPWRGSAADPANFRAMVQRFFEQDPARFRALKEALELPALEQRRVFAATKIEGFLPFADQLGDGNAQGLDTLVNEYSNRLLSQHEALRAIPDGEKRERIAREILRSALGIAGAAEKLRSETAGITLDPEKVPALLGARIKDFHPAARSASAKPDVEAVLDYDERRVQGKVHGPEEKLSTHSSAFTYPRTGNPLALTDAFFPDALGLDSETPLNREVDRAADRIQKHRGGGNFGQLREELERRIERSSEFHDLYRGGRIADHKEIRFRFMTALNRILEKEYGLPPRKGSTEPLARDGLSCAPEPGKKEPPTPKVASDGCMRCHSVATANERLRFPFDPFDGPSRTAWARTRGKAEREEWLKKLKRTVFTAKTMPPDGSPEKREVDLTSPPLRALREFIEDGLK